ncbi:MAG TPA: Lrp/AsnC family transcriptional regulator [Candidatus Acidoferrum sp.]|jgi:Lrp/AsnC family leucine-responsive transcriptional regulator|nr:Lrp/AsnC family transcriptional regulator [Candidatus Acidoferrum sp.]
MDPTDAKILNLLQEDCSRSLSELGRSVGLSTSGVNERLKRLRARGHVRAYVALVNPETLGYGTCAFVRLAVEGRKNEEAFLAAALKMLEVQEIHHVSGEFPFLLKIWARDVRHLEDLLNSQLKAHTGVLRVQTSVVLSSPKDRVTGLNAKA